MNQSEEENTTQHRRDLEAYKAWIKANFNAHGILVSSIGIFYCLCYVGTSARNIWGYISNPPPIVDYRI